MGAASLVKLSFSGTVLDAHDSIIYLLYSAWLIKLNNNIIGTALCVVIIRP